MVGLCLMGHQSLPDALHRVRQQLSARLPKQGVQRVQMTMDADPTPYQLTAGWWV